MSIQTPFESGQVNAPYEWKISIHNNYSDDKETCDQTLNNTSY